MAKRNGRLGVAPFDASAYLDNEEVIAEYLGAALEDRNPDVFLHAVRMSPRHAVSRRWPRTPAWSARASTRLSRRVPRSSTTQLGR